MIEILRRSGIDEKQSLLARVINGKDISELQGRRIKVNAGTSANLTASSLFPIHVIIQGNLQYSENNLSFLDYIDTDDQSVFVQAITNTVLLRLERQAAHIYLRQIQLMFKSLVESANIILNTNLPPDTYRKHMRLIKQPQGQKLIIEKEKGQSVYLLLEGTYKLTKQVESLSSQKQVQIFLHSSHKRYLVGEQALYNLPYNFTVIVNSNIGYFIQIFPGGINCITSQRLIDLKLDYHKRIQGLKIVQAKLGESPREHSNTRHHNSPVKTDQNKMPKKLMTLQGNLTLSHFRVKKNHRQNFIQTQSYENNDAEEPLKYFFQKNMDKVKFQLIHKGYVISQRKNYLKGNKHRSSLPLKRIICSSQPSMHSIGKQYLVPIMKKVKLKQQGKAKKLRA